MKIKIKFFVMTLTRTLQDTQTNKKNFMVYVMFRIIL